MNVSAESTLVLQGRFLAPLVGNQGNAGDVVPIVATLLNKNGTVPGAIVAALIEKPGGGNLTLLLDDGLHNDGAAGDGIYGWNTRTPRWAARITCALWPGSGTLSRAQWKTREWLGGFWINGPNLDDLDKDGMPDRWELRCKLNTQLNDAQGDMDNDGLLNIDEFLDGTVPVRSRYRPRRGEGWLGGKRWAQPVICAR